MACITECMKGGERFRARLMGGDDMPVLNNNAPLTEGTYVIMRDTDRWDDECYTDRSEAEDLMDSVDEDGVWIGRVEKINDQLEIIFVYGDLQ